MRPNTSPVKLSQIALGFALSNNDSEVVVTGITHNSREVKSGDLYVALPGANQHGIKFASQAIANGAVAIATDVQGQKEFTQNLPTILLGNARADMATLAARVYDHPDKKLTIVGVTGTNGKTSVTHILKSLFSNFGYRVGVIGTIGTYINGKHLPLARTTPESTDLYAILACMVEAQVTHVFMEVSSHALELHRVDGLIFDQAVFTNLSQDHLDFHGTMENYFAAKAKLFTANFAKHAVICTDDDWGQTLANLTSLPKTIIGQQGNWTTNNVRLSVTKTTFDLVHNHESMNCELPMIGAFNATNAALAIAVATNLGLDQQLVTRDLANVHPVPGRSQIVTHNSPGTAIVDYAHTPEAVEKVLTTLREVCDGQLITVLGCGGDRDPIKRPVMGAIAAQISDVVIITDDNPRSEDPAKIRAAVKNGISQTNVKVLEIGDRKEAIKTALSMISNNDVVAVLGKGHEQGQEIAGVVHPFDDVKVIQGQG